MAPPNETELYAPVKRFLEALGYDVKAEIGPADVVAVRRDVAAEDETNPVIVELKTSFSLTLLRQAVARLALTDTVYVAVPRPKGRGMRAFRGNVQLCRRLGVGVLTVRLRDGLVEVHADPGPYQPRRSTARRRRLLGEFARRQGDPNLGGTQGTRMTAYRQDALRCAAFLKANGPSRGAQVAAGAGVPHATRLLRDNHYGWFERIDRGVYGLATPSSIPEDLL